VRWCTAALVIFAIAASAAAAEELPAHELVLDLYTKGEYADCRGLVRRMIDDYVEGLIKVPVRDMANVYVVAACLEEVFRDAGWAEAVDEYLRIALEMDPNVDAAPAASRPFVADRLAEIRAGLLAAQGPTGRRYSIAFVLGIEGPGGIHWRSVPVFGVRVGAGVLPWLSIESGLSLPVQPPLLDEFECQLGCVVQPVFVLNRPMLIASASYVLTRAEGWSHGLRVEAGVEMALQSGVHLRAAAELLRIDGAAAPDPDETDFPSFTLFGAPVTIGLPRISISAAYTIHTF
jgi:hypothetical protein